MDENTENQDLSIERLRWKCRRGMLELDLILSSFLDQKYQDLNVENKKKFIQLLRCEDQELYNWLIKRELPEHSDFLEIIKLIGNFDKNT